MEEGHAEVAVLDRLQAALEGDDLVGRLGEHAAQRRLAEVGELRVGEAADEALRPDDPDAGAVGLVDRPGAVEDGDAAALERLDELIAAVDVPVVVAEHRDHRRG